jgi:RNA polymerase sigma-70 factor (ECF subfamily)
MSNDPWPSTKLSLLLQLKEPEAARAWTDFVNRYRPPIFRLIRDEFRLQDAEADDIAQTILMKLVDAMRTFEYDPEKKFRAWLRTVARNAICDALRRENRDPTRAQGSLPVDELPDRSSDAADRVSSTLIKALEDAERLVRQRVDPRTWQAFEAACAGTPTDEIARRTGMSKAAVYKAKSKVIRMIREEVFMFPEQT